MRLSFVLGALFVAAVPLAASAGQPSSGGCESLRSPQFPICRTTANGLVYAATAEEAEAAAAAAMEGEGSFSRLIGPVTPYAVVVGENIGDALRTLRAAGYSVVLPWLNPAARSRMRDESIRRGVEGRLNGSGMSRAQIDAAVAQALAQASGPGDGRLLTSYAAVAHELGHLWLMKAFWGDVVAGEARAGHYGGPGPDWLDETVAVMMENELLTAPRRVRFRELVREVAPGRVMPLAEFFSADHPLKGLGTLVRSGQLGAAAQPGAALILTGDEVNRRLGVAPEAGPNFYAQARATADFLLASSGDPRIVGRIAEAVSRGESVDTWLARYGAAAGLPGTMAELEARWQRWAASAYAEGTE